MLEGIGPDLFNGSVFGIRLQLFSETEAKHVATSSDGLLH
jgi:hypothetical protein